MRPALRSSLATAVFGSWLVLGASATPDVSDQTPPAQTPPVQTPAAQTPVQPAGPPPADGQQPPKPVFRTGAELVRVDVAVLDRKGVPVTSLTAADFELEEDGVAQEIRTFQFIQNTGQPDKDDDVSLTIRSRSHAASEASKDNVRLFLIFWDEYHIGQMVSANRARAYLMQFVRTAFGPTDIVGFMDPLTPIDAIKFTRDRLELAEHVRRLVGRSGVYVPTRSGVEDAHLQQGDVESCDPRSRYRPCKSAAVHLGGIRDGRKALIVISEGLRGIQRDSTRLMTDLIRAANDNNTAIYAVDPRGLGAAAVPVHLGIGGGRHRRGLLPVERSRPGVPPGRRRIERLLPARVRADRPPAGWTLPQDQGSGEALGARRARAHGLLGAERRRDRARPDQGGRSRDSAGHGARAVGAAGNERRGGRWISGRARRSTTGGRLSGCRGCRAASCPRGRQSRRRSRQSRSHGETRVFEGPVDSSGASFPAPPGALKVTFTVEDSAKEIIDRDVRTIEVPDPAAAALWMTSPALFRSQNAREFRSLDRGPNALPFPGREFERTDRLIIRFEVQGTAAATATVSARIISRWGKDLAELPFLPRPTGVGPYEIDLPLSSVARGDYLIAMAASAGDRPRARDSCRYRW